MYAKDRKVKHIQGICILKDEQEFFDKFCQKIQVVLEDQKGKIIAGTSTGENGTFRFEDVEPGKYMLKIQSTKFEKVSEHIFVTPGSEVLLHLIRIKN